MIVKKRKGGLEHFESRQWFLTVFFFFNPLLLTMPIYALLFEVIIDERREFIFCNLKITWMTYFSVLTHQSRITASRG